MNPRAEYVRTIQQGETIKDLIEELKALAWVNNVEFAVVQLKTRQRFIVRGGPKGIEFLLNEEETEVLVLLENRLVPIRRIFFHTHPRVTGPSEDDFKILKILGQTRSIILEIGGETGGTVIRPKETDL